LGLANNQVLTAGADGMLKIWAPKPMPKPGTPEEKPVKVLEAHVGGVADAAAHPDGKQMVSGGADKTVKVWDTTTGKATRTIGPLPEVVTAVAFSRDGTQFGAVTNKTVRIWNTADGKEVASFVHASPVTALTFNQDKTRIATATDDQRTRVWDIVTGKELQSFTQEGQARNVFFGNNNTILAAAGKTPVVFGFSLLKAVPVSGSPVLSMTLTNGGGQVLTGSADKSVKLWNAGNGNLERSFIGAEAPVAAVAISHNNVLVAAAGSDRSVRIYTLGDGKQQGMFKTQGVVRSLAFTPNDQVLAAACDDKSILTWNVTYRQPLPPEFGKPGQTFSHPAGVADVMFAQDNIGLYSAGEDKNIYSWKLASETPIKNFGHPNFVDAVAFNSTGTQLATGCHDGTVRIWDIAKGQQIKQIDAHTKPMPSPVYCVAWSADGKQVVSGSLDHTMKLWDAASGNLVREFKAYKVKEFEKGHQDAVFCLAFSPDGKTIASGSSDRSIKIWNVADGSVLRTFVNPNVKQPAAIPGVPPAPPESHPGWVYSLQFISGGSRLVSVGNAPGNQGYVAVWNVPDGKLVASELSQLGPFNSVAPSPDGKLLAVGCSPHGRVFQDVESYVIRTPGTTPQQTTSAAR
jgi:WD40 repeat protein